MIRTQGLTHIHLVVRDLERSLRFYQGVFGMEERFRDGPKMVFLNTPGSEDLITLNEDPAAAAQIQRRTRLGLWRYSFTAAARIRVAPYPLASARIFNPKAKGASGVPHTKKQPRK
jgi:catechol 2,3-dioxygenase-like lactoylglutathione lyase family enzyme